MTAKRRQTLEERIVRFSVSSGSLAENLLRDVAMRDCVRAELDRVARQVRVKRREFESFLHPGIPDPNMQGRIDGLDDVLVLIKQAKR